MLSVTLGSQLNYNIPRRPDLVIGLRRGSFIGPSIDKTRILLYNRLRDIPTTHGAGLFPLKTKMAWTLPTLI